MTHYYSKKHLHQSFINNSSGRSTKRIAPIESDIANGSNLYIADPVPISQGSKTRQQ